MAMWGSMFLSHTVPHCLPLSLPLSCLWLCPCAQAPQALPQAVRALVLVPSRELALQVLRCLRRLAAATDLRVAELGDGDPAALR